VLVVALWAPVLHGQTKTAPKPEALDKLLAPVALYPDQLLAQVLLCATKPGEVVAMNGWLATTTTLKGSELQDAAVKAGFDASCVALALFPQTLKMMAGQVDWTTAVGQAFTANRSLVFESIQRLRKQAQQAGNLKTTPQQEVETRTTSAGEQVIVIEPSNPQVVYVPQYNPTVVYTQPSTTTVVVERETSSADAAAAGVIGFAAGIAIGAAIDNDYYYGPYGWHGGPAYMYNDAWDDWYDHREDAREDWMEHREDVVEERGDRARDTQEQRTDRQQNRQENRPETQQQRQERRTEAQSAAQTRTQGASTQTRTQSSSTQTRTQGASTQARSANQGTRGYGSTTQKTAPAERSGTRSDAFSGYSSGQSQRAASSRGQRSRTSSSSRRSSGGRRR
jgi:hypothetical protein